MQQLHYCNINNVMVLSINKTRCEENFAEHGTDPADASIHVIWLITDSHKIINRILPAVTAGD